MDHDHWLGGGVKECRRPCSDAFTEKKKIALRIALPYTAALARRASLLEPFLHFNLFSCKLRAMIKTFLRKTKSAYVPTAGAQVLLCQLHS
jgi:hypothetical protein